ncbi:MAG: nucleoside-diphosphate kinase [Caldithrix sp.]|nr:nucleoside-diphosphate kinase [Caldithrix sp.]
MEKTLAIIKPDAVQAGYTGEIIKRIEEDGLIIRAMRMEHLDRKRAEGFYYVHRQKSFFNELINFMTSGPCVLLVLSAYNVINRWRNLMGPTDPKSGHPDTIRRAMGTNIERNAVHGSDSKDSAVYEVNYFFKGTEIFER